MSLEPRVDRGVPELTARGVRASFPKGTLAVRVREALGPLFENESIAEAFPGRGRPAVSPGALALVSVLQYAEGLTDRQAADQVRARMDWKFLLGLELDDPGFDFSVLCDFRARLIEHGLEEKVLDLVLERISGVGLLRAGGRQRTDSTHVLAAVRTVNRMEFVGETLHSPLEALSVAAPQWLSALVTAGWVRRYGARIDSWRFPKGENVRQEWAAQVGRDGFTILEAAFAPGSPGWLREIPAVQVLRRAWVEQYHRDGEGVHLREGKDLPPGRCRLSSPYDCDARYGVKRGSGWCGYKAHLSETCESDAPHLITQVITTDAKVVDTEVTETVHQGLAARELLPAEHDVDAGYVLAAHIVTARNEYGIELVGPVGLDTCHENHEGEHFTQSAFTVDWQARKVTCPEGKISASWPDQRKSSGTPVARVHFTARDCGSCPVREKSTKAANGKGGRSLTLLPQDQQEALEARRHEQLTDEWQQRYNIRAGVEGTISQAVRRTRIRRTRFTGLPKTHLGHVFAATAINIIRLDAWFTQTPLGQTRTSHLTRLDLAA
ncbi:IS1182 family transposase [Streptomyces sp. WAC07094]|uniref:IS1182 family transposase n=1 Tax=Streptomyces sp. WAC07094 TaxID=3072183 RepID=UPI002EAADF15|nr:IS1182 family transposase [Streptomyces sp. WAC07094]